MPRRRHQVPRLLAAFPCLNVALGHRLTAAAGTLRSRTQRGQDRWARPADSICEAASKVRQETRNGEEIRIAAKLASVDLRARR